MNQDSAIISFRIYSVAENGSSSLIQTDAYGCNASDAPERTSRSTLRSLYPHGTYFVVPTHGNPNGARSLFTLTSPPQPAAVAAPRGLRG